MGGHIAVGGAPMFDKIPQLEGSIGAAVSGLLGISAEHKRYLTPEASAELGLRQKYAMSEKARETYLEEIEWEVARLSSLAGGIAAQHDPQ
jgi:hypothetical protein